jgi:hypothetical protein
LKLFTLQFLSEVQLYPQTSPEEEKVDLDYSKIISIPYIRGTSEKIRNLMFNYDYKVVYKKGHKHK